MEMRIGKIKWRNKLKVNLFDRVTKSLQGFLTVGVLLIFIAPGVAAEKEIPHQYGVFVYSNFCRSEMSGDLYGNRITILKVIDGDTVVFEYTDGSTHAVIANNLSFEEMTGKISFEVRVDKDLHSIIVGNFSADRENLRITGAPFDEDLNFDLKKIHDFKAPYPFCTKRK